MLPKPRLLLLDEPTAGVDPKARREFWDQIHDLAAAGITVLVSTHYMDEAERCHEIAYIAYGLMLARGTIDEVIAGSHLHALLGEGPGADRLDVDERKLQHMLDMTRDRVAVELRGAEGVPRRVRDPALDEGAHLATFVGAQA